MALQYAVVICASDRNYGDDRDLDFIFEVPVQNLLNYPLVLGKPIIVQLLRS